jgi:Flp pilus assembly pilin Flp
MLFDSFSKFLNDEDGQSIVEYSLLLTLVAATSVMVLTIMGLSFSRVLGTNDFTVEGYYNWAYEKYKTR